MLRHFHTPWVAWKVMWICYVNGMIERIRATDIFILLGGLKGHVDFLIGLFIFLLFFHLLFQRLKILLTKHLNGNHLQVFLGHNIKFFMVKESLITF